MLLFTFIKSIFFSYLFTLVKLALCEAVRSELGDNSMIDTLTGPTDSLLSQSSGCESKRQTPAGEANALFWTLVWSRYWAGIKC